MRNVFLCSVFLVLGIGGCGGDDTHVDMQPDVKIVDLSGPDLTTLSSCGDLIDCGNACTTQACLTACVKKGSASAQSAYKALGDCIDTTCPTQLAADGGTPKPCDVSSATMMYVDKAACDKCVSDSQMNGGACKAKLDACAADGA